LAEERRQARSTDAPPRSGYHAPMALLQMIFYDAVDGSPQRPATTWDNAAAAAGNAELVAAVSLFRKLLGEDWKGWAETRPLASHFGMSFQGGPPEWVRLWRLIQHLENVEGVEALVRHDLGSSAWA